MDILMEKIIVEFVKYNTTENKLYKPWYNKSWEDRQIFDNVIDILKKMNIDTEEEYGIRVLLHSTTLYIMLKNASKYLLNEDLDVERFVKYYTLLTFNTPYNEEEPMSMLNFHGYLRDCKKLG